MKRTLDEIGMYAMAAKPHMQLLGTTKKNQALEAVANALNEKADYLIAENEKDMQAGKEAGMHQGLLDRLLLTKDRIAQMAEGLIQIAGLEDPIGEVLSMKKRPNGLLIGQKRVPLGVVGIIYESRPNVTADAFGLCFKTGNVVVLKGGSDAMHSNIAIVKVIREALRACKVDEDAIQLIEDTDRAVTTALMKRKDFLDVLIPRGGAAHFFLVIGQFQFCFIESFDVFPDYPFLSCFMHQHRLMRLVIDHKMLHWKTVCKMLPDQRQNLCLRCDHRKQNPLFQLPESQKFTTVPCLPPGFSRHPENAKNGRMLQCMDELFPGMQCQHNHSVDVICFLIIR